MNRMSFARFYISYLLFNVGGWIYFGHLLYYSGYITYENCNKYTKELTDVGKIFVGLSMAFTTMNMIGATSSILNNINDGFDDDDAFSIDNMMCIIVTTFMFLTIASMASLAIFGITSGLTNIQCDNSNAEFAIKLMVYGLVWIAFIQLFIIACTILLFIYNIIVAAKFQLLCWERVFGERRRRRRNNITPEATVATTVAVEDAGRIELDMTTTSASVSASVSASHSISKYDTRHIEITIPPPVATYKEEPTVLCSVCYDASITLLLEPCSHICMCHVCYESLVKKECPICKTAISATRKIYFATPGGK